MIEKNQNTEQVILQVAKDIFIEKGYAAGKTTEIAGRAGVNHSMLHYYYRTKKNLFSIVFRSQVELLAGSFLAIQDNDMPFREFITSAVVRHFEFLKANPKVVMFILSEINNNSIGRAIWKEETKAVFSKVFSTLKRKMQKEMEAKNIRSLDPLNFLVTIISLNVFVFIAQPLLDSLKKFTQEEFEAFLEERKKENIRLALMALDL